VGRPPRIENARDHILAVAAEIFATKGFEATSMDEISRAIGSSKAAIYHYFDSKRLLYDRLIVETLSDMLRSVSDAVGRQASPPAKMKAYLSSHVEYMERNLAVVSTIVQSASLHNREFTEAEIRLRAEFENLIGEIVSAGTRDGSFRQVDIPVAQKAILGMLAWMPKWIRSAPELPTKRIVGAYLDLIMSGLTPRKTRLEPLTSAVKLAST
jgi:AcrR family transcriptional regulator